MRFTMRSRFSASFCLSGFTGVVAINQFSSVMMPPTVTMPSFRATQSACILCPLPDCTFLDTFLLPRAENNPFYVNAGQVHLIRIKLPRLHDLFHLVNGH